MTFNYPTRKDGLFLLRNKDYEDIAEKVLKEYAPYMLTEVRELDLEKLADALGLLIDEEYLSIDGSILGAIAFEDTEELYYDFAMRPKKVKMGQGQILIDPRLNGLYSYGRRRYTIAHEIGHWLTQRTYHSPTNQQYEYRKSVVVCRSESIENASKNKDWVEIQANRTAASLLMPKENFINTAEEIISHAGLLGNCLQESRIREERSREVISAIAKCYGVSKKAAEIRLSQLNLIKRA